MKRRYWLAAGLIVAASAACSSGTLVTPSTGTTPPGGTARVTFAVVVPAGRRPHFVSPSTQSIVVATGSQTILTLDVSASSSSCKRAAGGARTCDGVASAPSGRQVFAVTAYDGADGSGNVLATGNVAATLPAGGSKRVRLTLTGAPASIALSLQPAYPPAGTPAAVAVTLAALDADGNTILGSYGKPITLADDDATEASKLSATSVSTSSQTITLAYDGSPLERAVVTARSGGLRASVIFAPVPSIVAQYSPPPIASSPQPLPPGLGEICMGPDGNLWATAPFAGGIEKISLDGNFTGYSIPGSDPIGISVGSDRNLWFTEQALGSVARITTAGKVTSFKIPVPRKGFSQPAWTAAGPDGRIWFVNQGSPVTIGAITTAGKITQYPMPANSFPNEIVAGPDGNMWITDAGLNAVVAMTTSGKIVATHVLPTPGAQPWGIAVGPDKNLWFAEYNLDRVARMTSTGKLAEFAVPTAVAGVLDVAAGPDGNVWFAESGGSVGVAGKIGYVSVGGSKIRDFPTGNVFHVHDLVFDSKGALWFTEFAGPASLLAKLIY
jgi:streptogramin lyase